MPTDTVILCVLLLIMFICSSALTVSAAKIQCYVFVILFGILAITSGLGLYAIGNNEEIYRHTLHIKPTCIEDSKECLEEKIEWTKDSIFAAKRLKSEQIKAINFEVFGTDSAKIEALKLELKNLTQGE